MDGIDFDNLPTWVYIVMSLAIFGSVFALMVWAVYSAHKQNKQERAEFESLSRALLEPLIASGFRVVEKASSYRADGRVQGWYVQVETWRVVRKPWSHAMRVEFMWRPKPEVPTGMMISADWFQEKASAEQVRAGARDADTNIYAIKPERWRGVEDGDLDALGEVLTKRGGTLQFYEDRAVWILRGIRPETFMEDLNAWVACLRRFGAPGVDMP